MTDRCEKCPFFNDCGFVHIGGYPYCKRETEGSLIITTSSEIPNNSQIKNPLLREGAIPRKV